MKTTQHTVCAHCRKCSPLIGRVLCIECAEKQKIYKSKKVNSGLCRSCSKHREFNRLNRTRCSECAEKERKYAKDIRPIIAEKINARQRANYWADPEKNNTINKQWRIKARKRVYDAYGGAKCACCGENEELFLTLDHINNDGNVYRKKTGSIRTGAATYLWAIKNNFPPTLQILCYNCNCGRYRNGGLCPHKK